MGCWVLDAQRCTSFATSMASSFAWSSLDFGGEHTKMSVSRTVGEKTKDAAVMAEAMLDAILETR